MGSKTGIEWTDATWNPFMGCSRVSEGCRHCYAERMAGRFAPKAAEGSLYHGLTHLVNGTQVWTGKINSAPEYTWEAPLRWRKPRRIFVNSMSDLFHENVPDVWIDRVLATMALAPRHIFQVLTKRPERMLAYFSDLRARTLSIIDRMADIRYMGFEPDGVDLPLSNVWLGVSAENQKAADERLPILAKVPCRVRFVSCEPLLGPLDITRWINRDAIRESEGSWVSEQVDWVICGGESGPGARPMDPDWARSLRDQCVAAGVPFFMKQMGSAFGPQKGHDLPPDLDIKQFPKVAA